MDIYWIFKLLFFLRDFFFQGFLWDFEGIFVGFYGIFLWDFHGIFKGFLWDFKGFFVFLLDFKGIFLWDFYWRDFLCDF